MSFPDWEFKKLQEGLLRYRKKRSKGKRKLFPIEGVLEDMKKSPGIKGDMKYFTVHQGVPQFLIRNNALLQFTHGREMQDSSLQLLKNFLIQKKVVKEADFQLDSHYFGFMHIYSLLANTSDKAKIRLEHIAKTDHSLVIIGPPAAHIDVQTGNTTHVELIFEPDQFDHLFRAEERSRAVKGNSLPPSWQGDPLAPITYRYGFGFLCTERRRLFIFLMGLSPIDTISYVEAEGYETNDLRLLRVGEKVTIFNADCIDIKHEQSVGLTSQCFGICAFIPQERDPYRISWGLK